MSYQTFAPPVRPKTSSASVEVKTVSVDFGDGYSQVSADGLNAARETLALTWPVLTFAQAAQIHAFFKARDAQPFWWSLPGEPARLWRCTKWTRPFSAGTQSMTAELAEVFA